MDYISPYGADPGDPYVDDNEALEVDGSIPPAQFFNDVQAELLNLLAAAGIVPAAGDLTQVAQAIQQMIIAGGKTVKITNATFEGTVTDGNPVRWDAGTGEYVKALADGTAANRAVGVADVTNSEVIFFGITRAGLFAGLTLGARQYLSGAVAGAMVEAAPADPVRLGIALSATQMFVDVDPGKSSIDTSGRLLSSQVFTAAGTWVKPAGVNKVVVWVVGGGGGGGGVSNATKAGAGGSGGGTAIKTIDVSAITDETVTIGAGGPGAPAGPNSGTPGGTTSFGAHCSATGGGAGQSNGDVSNPGVGVNGDINMSGGGGQSTGEMSGGAIHIAGAGGPSFLGGGAQGGRSTIDGYDAGDYGGGGGGAANDGALGDRAGGDGGPGIIVVWEYS